MTKAADPDAAAPASAIYKRLLPGDRFPAEPQLCGDHAKFAFVTLAGRYQLYGFFLSADDPAIRQAIEAVAARRDLFDDVHASFFGVSVMPGDRDAHRLANAEPGVRFVWDFDRRMSDVCGATPLNAASDNISAVSRKWILLDPSMRVVNIWPMRETPVEAVIATVEALPPPDRFGGVSRPAPVLMLPNVLEPELCRRLVDLHAGGGGRDIGFFRGGKKVFDPSFKSRSDVSIADPALIEILKEKLGRRVLPEIEKLFFMRASYVERHLIGGYSAADGGHFMPHVDNGAPSTAHRRFAVSINLNDDFEGGEVVFPEYNLAGYKAPAGWAVVFPAAILHGVRRVTSGVRYAYLPFMFDEAGEAIRVAERVKAEAAKET
ncbi:2OG-Fe(II) oxygenase [Phenylobacterium sp.]|uniref:2OG-Fe(II) oxygenase n=1 Tax=Phenylobacterium sp. TaxID=1871053 RepID=UPI002B883EAD|nr:2OG-Fe(II) oxygenase [Phenylobacterium sp.]HLZ77651.1 2OG-Fe(II) oxygenase [Phenylobacterium sp.]